MTTPDFAAKAREAIAESIDTEDGSRFYPYCNPDQLNRVIKALAEVDAAAAEARGFRRGIDAVLALPRPHTLAGYRQEICALLKVGHMKAKEKETEEMSAGPGDGYGDG